MKIGKVKRFILIHITKMKKTFIAAAMVACTMTLSSCGIGSATGTTTDNTTSSNGSVLGSLASAALSGAQQNVSSSLKNSASSLLSSSTTQSLLTGLMSSLLSGTTTSESIVGTWKYSAPEVRFESDNLLAKAGGIVVANQLKTKMETQLTKFGFTSGKTTFTFNNNNYFTASIGGKSVMGTWSYDQSSNKLTLKGALGLTSMNCTCSVVGGNLYMLFDASKLMSLASALGSSTSTLSSITSSYSGMKMGWSMTK